MALLNILQFPDPRLKEVAEPVEKFDEEIITIAENLFETMYEASGVGLAATQVAIKKRILVTDTTRDRSNPICMVNPEIVEKSGSLTWQEGCLSFPGVYAKVKRYEKIKVNFYTETGEQKSISVENDHLFAVCIQHEIDHLNGVTFFDHLSSLKQTMLRRKLQKIREKSL